MHSQQAVGALVHRLMRHIPSPLQRINLRDQAHDALVPGLGSAPQEARFLHGVLEHRIHEFARRLLLRVPMLGLTQLSNYLTLKGSFSAVSTATIAREDAFCNILRDLQDLHSFAPLWPENCIKFSSRFFLKFHNWSFKKNRQILEFSSRILLKLDWQSITKKMWGRKEKREKWKGARKSSWVTWPNFVRIAQIVQKMLPIWNAENQKNIAEILV